MSSRTQFNYIAYLIKKYAHWDCCLDVAKWLVRPNDSKS